MFRKSPAKRTAVTGTGLAFEPINFGDRVAEVTEWAPLIRGGTNFRTRKLKVMGTECLKFRPTLGTLLFALLFILLGGFMALLAAAGIIGSGMTNDRAVFLALGLFFAAGGGYMWFYFTLPIVFDKTQGSFGKGHNPDPAWVSNLSAACPLQQIHALQLISEACRRSTDDSYRRTRWYHSFELNLVLHNGERLNVVDHGHYQGIRQDADALADFLGVPVWDACG